MPILSYWQKKNKKEAIENIQQYLIQIAHFQ